MIMGMPITVAIPDRERQDPLPDAMKYPTVQDAADAVFEYLTHVDERFSPYKPESETCRIDRGDLEPRLASTEMQEVLRLSEETKALTGGYFDVWLNGHFDPSGLVKGWAIVQAARILDEDNFISFCIEAGGDIEVRGANDEGRPWAIGVRNPFDTETLTHRLLLQNRGIATSGTYLAARPVRSATVACVPVSACHTGLSSTCMHEILARAGADIDWITGPIEPERWP